MMTDRLPAVVKRTNHPAVHQLVTGLLFKNDYVHVELLTTRPVEGPNSEVFTVRAVASRDAKGHQYLAVYINADADFRHLLAWYNIPLPKKGEFRLHRLVAMLKYRRPLAVDEHAHHLNFNPLDNGEGNIEAMRRRQHHELHLQEPRRGVSPEQLPPLFLRVVYPRGRVVVPPPKRQGRQARRGGRRTVALDSLNGSTNEASQLRPHLACSTVAPTDCGPYIPHADDHEVLGSPIVEQIVEVRSRGRLPQSRELSRLGLGEEDAARALSLLKHLRRHGGFGSVAELAAAVRPACGRTILYRILAFLVAAEGLRRLKKGRYKLLW